ncbi:TonB-linked outer membrane protein, SusC/RagA family [Paenimyroides aquimaris]|uniref:TonB-linked outer membrane protein, SusC/RagA family n=1 Tax=Paenimyroides marinum TaxID=1159016 RepID=A0A1H6L152_9FLAO|nr:SusC/RagA family TonB-linked outer membrane protein [Paenimyroides aquimaris]SEH77996.1 TonB-linked outer membrane protein, SusC/RagA family [Paenimyroides aquimaris]
MNKRFFVTLTVAFAFCGLTSAYAQEKVVTGTVKVGTEAVSGADVVVNGGESGTVTDDDGGYSISVNIGDTVEYHYVGFKSETRTINASTQVINVTLTEDEGLLDEIVVMAYGQQRNKNEITGNVVKISGEEVSKAPMVSADQALQGRVAGLSMATNSGTPGSTQQIRIRGLNSVTGSNDPLIVIDGVIVTNNNLSGDSENASSLSALSAINSNDIESMTVLKDAAATSVYGARGANGVIVITTKRGKEGVTRYEFTSSLGFQNNAVKGPRSLTGQEKMDLLLEAYNNTMNGGGAFDKDAVYQQLIAQYPGETASLQAWVDSGKPVNNWNELMRNKNAVVSILNFSATGGDEKSNFYASLGHNKTEGTVIGSDFRRISGMFTFNRKMSDKVDFGFSANVSNIKQEGVLEQGAFFSNPNLIRYFMSPWASPYNADGSLNLGGGMAGLHNPLYTIPNNIRINDVIRVLNNNSISYKFTDDLKFTSQLSTDFTYIAYRNYNNPIHGDGAAYNGYAENSTSTIFKYIAQNGFDYRFYLGDDHKFDVKVLMEYEKVKRNYLYGFGENIPEGFDMLGNASANFSASTTFTDEANLAYLGLVNYSYMNKYLIDASVRREGNSKFHPDNRWGTFWSIGAAWNIMNEDFLLSNNTISTLRLRGSYGTSGNQGIPVNMYQNTLATDRYDGDTGFVPSQLGQDITWESLKKTDVGINIGFLQDRFTASFAYFKSATSDMLLQVPITRTSGFSSVLMNTGTLENKGIEIEASARIIDKENFSWTLYGNIGTVKNKITEMPTDASGEKMTITSSTTRTEEGHEMRGWYMPKYAGVDAQTGDALWYVNGHDGETTNVYSDAKVDWQGGSAMPTYTAGLGTQIEMGGFFAGANFSFVGGNKVYEDWGQYVQGTSTAALLTFNSTDYIMDRWQNPGDVTNTPKLTFTSNDNHRASTRFLKDGDYVRLRDVTFGYNFKGNVLDQLNIDGLSLSVRGTNLYTWTKDKTLKFDPEVGMNAGDGTYGYTGFISPPVKSIIFTVNVKF